MILSERVGRVLVLVREEQDLSTVTPNKPISPPMDYTITHPILKTELLKSQTRPFTPRALQDLMRCQNSPSEKLIHPQRSPPPLLLPPWLIT